MKRSFWVVYFLTGFFAAALGGAARAQTASDVSDGFIGTDGKPVSITVRAPENSGGAVVRLTDSDVMKQAAALALGRPQLMDYYLFQVAVNKVRVTHAGMLSLDARTYDIHAPANVDKGHGIVNFSNLSDVVIDGNGAMIRFSDVDFRAGVLLGRDTRVTMRNVSVDWGIPLTFPGRLIAGPSGRPSFRADPGTTFAPDESIQQLMRFDTQRRRFYESGQFSPPDRAAWNVDHNPVCHSRDIVPKCFTVVSDSELSFGQNESMSTSLNATVLATVRDNGFVAVFADLGSDIVLDHVRVLSSPGAGIVGYGMGPGFAIIHCAVVRKPDAELAPGEAVRFLSSASDAIDVMVGSGDVLIEDNDINYAGDDAIVLRGHGRQASTSDGRVFRLADASNYAQEFNTGDTVTIYDGGTLAVLARSVPIASVSAEQSSIVLARSVSGALSSSSVFISSDRVANNNAIIRNNRIRDSLNRGIVIHGGNMLVENNVIERMGLSGIQVMGFNPGDFPPAHNIIVRGNTLSHVNFYWANVPVGGQPYPGALMVYASRDGGRTVSSASANTDIDITNNRIQDVPGVGIYIASAANVRTSGNSFDTVNRAGLFKAQPSDIFIDRVTTQNVHVN